MKEQNILLPGQPGKFVYTNDPAYMDDLINPSVTLDALQKSRHNVSVLRNILSGYNNTQSEVIHSHWSSVNISNNPQLLVHRGDWVAQTVKLHVSTRQDALALKYLGIQNILINTSTTQLILSPATQRQALRKAKRRATPFTKAMVYNMFVLPKIGCYAPHLASSLKDVREKLDKPGHSPMRETIPVANARLGCHV